MILCDSVWYNRRVPLFRRIVAPIQSLPIGRKLVLIYVFGIFAPLVISNGLVLRSVAQDTLKQEQLFLQASITNVAHNVAREFEPILLATEFVYADRLIYRLLAVSYESFDQFIDIHREQLMPALAKYVSVFPSVTRMIVYTDNPILRVAEGYLNLDDFARGTAWFAALAAARPGIVALVHTDTDPRLVIEGQRVLSVFRELDNPITTRLGRMVLRVDVNAPIIERALASSEVVGSIEVVDSNGTVVVSRQTADIGDHGYRFDDPLSTVAALRGWRVRGAIAPVQPIAPWSLRWTRLLIVSGFSLAGASLFILLLSRSVTSRLRSLSEQMRKVEREDFSPLTLPSTADDEVAHLIEDYNLMARKIDALINSGYKLEIERHQLMVANQQAELGKQQAELGALQSQVNPHFLYNVLESIRMKASIKGERETAQVIKKLSRAFRRITTWKSDIVTVGEEIDFTREYLEIQQYRFGMKLQTRIDIDPGATNATIPKMTIQGLVENACVHGIEGKPGGGTIAITALRHGDSVRISVHDDGVGCEPVAALAGSDQSRSGGHIGLSNLRRRLRYHYHDRFGFRFDSAPGRGTEVVIQIPLADGEDDGDTDDGSTRERTVTASARQLPVGSVVTPGDGDRA